MTVFRRSYRCYRGNILDRGEYSYIVKDSIRQLNYAALRQVSWGMRLFDSEGLGGFFAVFAAICCGSGSL